MRPGLPADGFRAKMLRWSPEGVFMVTALAVGLGGGVMAVVFRYLIDFFEWLSYDRLPALFPGSLAYVVIAPTIGGLLVGILVYRYAPEARGHGVPEVMEAVALRGGRIRPAVVAVKALASSICIGSGGSVGREGPIVQIGSALGSAMAQWLRLSEERVANLVACGAAAGIAATFNAPIAGVIFALEVILGGRFGVPYFSSVVVSAVAASVIGHAAFGNVPAFRIPYEFGITSLWEYGLYIGLGVVAAVCATGYVRLLYAAEDWFEAWRRVPVWIKPAVGGMLLGGLALLYPKVTPVAWDGVPQVFNVGYEVIEQALANELAMSVLVSLLVLKLIATTLTLGSGGSGGVFAPALFMGAMLGGAYELAMAQLFPGYVGPAGAYALVGMAAFFAASAHAPISAVIILFELTGDYRIILALMLTTVVATVVARRLLNGESIYTLKLSRRGTRLAHGRDQSVLESVTVEEAMSHDFETIPATTRLGDLGSLFERYRRTALFAVDAHGSLAGIVTVGDYERAQEAGLPADTGVTTVGTFGPDLVTASIDQHAGDVLSAMAGRGIGRIPVVARDSNTLIGVVRRGDILRSYHLASSRRVETRDHAIADAARGRAEVVNIVLGGEAAAVGKSLRELAGDLPRDAVVVAVERGDQLIIPRGDTVLDHGDRVSVFVRREQAGEVLRALQG